LGLAAFLLIPTEVDTPSKTATRLTATPIADGIWELARSSRPRHPAQHRSATTSKRPETSVRECDIQKIPHRIPHKIAQSALVGSK